jgi:hypothetical protein
MPNVWIAAAIAAGVVLALGLSVSFMRRKAAPVSFTDEREERLTQKLADMLGCTLAEALPAMRRELQIAPNQPDDTLLKRAAYHYRRTLPDGACRVWRDRTPG